MGAGRQAGRHVGGSTSTGGVSRLTLEDSGHTITMTWHLTVDRHMLPPTSVRYLWLAPRTCQHPVTPVVTTAAEAPMVDTGVLSKNSATGQRALHPSTQIREWAR